MKPTLLALIAAAMLTSAFAKEPTLDLATLDSATMTQHAAQVVANLHDDMLDPASFVLDAVYVTKPNRRGSVSVCYEYRSHNRMGGYTAGRAVEDGAYHNEIQTTHVDDGYGKYPGYDV